MERRVRPTRTRVKLSAKHSKGKRAYSQLRAGRLAPYLAGLAQFSPQTTLHDLGIDDKTIQSVLRHSNVAVTQASYIKTLPKQTLEAMERLNAEVESVQ